MNGLDFARQLDRNAPMPMAGHFAFRLLEIGKGSIVAEATPDSSHENPFHVVQGGFASTVLDMALGILTISVLTSAAVSVATTDLSVRYLRGVSSNSGRMIIRGSVLHAGRQVIVAQTILEDSQGKLCAIAQSSSLIAYATNS